MPIIHDIAQGDADWLTLRIGKVTASELDNLLTPEFKPRTGETPHTYLCSKLAEAWRGKPLPGFSSWATEQGQLLEDEARKWYAFEFDRETVRNVGFVEHDSLPCGCSPDALIDDDCGLELKCPEPTNHVKYLLAGTLPKAYAAQVHMSMFVTGRPRWKFVSYRRGFPAFVLEVVRCPEICDAIETAVERFAKAMADGMADLQEANK